MTYYKILITNVILLFSATFVSADVVINDENFPDEHFRGWVLSQEYGKDSVLTDEEIAGMQVFAKKVAIAIKKAIPCVKVGQCVLGLEVPHAHIHLVPMQSEADLRFTNPRVELTKDEFEEIAKSIRVQL